MINLNENLYSVWKTNILDPSLPVTAKGLTPTAQSIIGSLIAQQPVDLRDLPLDSINVVHLAVVLRVTSSRKVPGWDEALKKARIVAKQKGYPEEDVLGGLF